MAVGPTFLSLSSSALLFVLEVLFFIFRVTFCVGKVTPHLRGSDQFPSDFDSLMRFIIVDSTMSLIPFLPLSFLNKARMVSYAKANPSPT